MLGALLAAREAGPLLKVRRLAHRSFAQLAFAMESLAVTGSLFVGLTYLVCRCDPLLLVREWGRFLTHFELADPAQRIPVNIFLFAVLGLLFGFTVAVRWPSHRRGWSTADWQASERGVGPEPQPCSSVEVVAA